MLGKRGCCKQWIKGMLWGKETRKGERKPYSLERLENTQPLTNGGALSLT